MIIYKVTNLITGKIYIGQTTLSLKRRWLDHCNHGNYLYRSIKKHGKENFTIEEIDGANSLSELNYLEQHYIYMYDCMSPNGYNLTSGGGSCYVSEETRLKLSAALKGKKRSDEVKLNISNGQRGRVHSQETKNKIKEALKAKNILKRIIDNNGNIYESIHEASRILKIDLSSLHKVLNKKRKTVNKMTFEFLD